MKKISPLSIKGFNNIKDLKGNIKEVEVDISNLPKENFTQDQLQECWNDFSKIQEQKGKRIFVSYMNLSEIKLDKTRILLEFPNEGSKLDFENSYHELLNHLRKNLKNYDITIHINVTETYKPKVMFTPEDKYKHFVELNPLIEIFRKTFELDI